MAQDREPAFEKAVDVWRAEQAASLANPRHLSREEAVRLLASEALVGMGLLKPADRPQ